jgi:Fe2+ transport system protein B
MHLRLPVIPVQAHKGIGIDQLKNAIRGIAGKRVERLELPLPEVMETHIERLQRILREEKLAAADQAEWDAHIMLTTGDDDDVPDRRRDHPRVRGALSAAIDDLAQHDIDPIAATLAALYMIALLWMMPRQRMAKSARPPPPPIASTGC